MALFGFNLRYSYFMSPNTIDQLIIANQGNLVSKCAKYPLCYENLHLRTLLPRVNNAVVATMIQRVGKALRYEILDCTDCVIPSTSMLHLMLPRKLQFHRDPDSSSSSVNVSVSTTK
ncbi:hypothetical protein MTR_7g094400 [Medicago truncatula]|uniref:Uncharacterized protein n=1 Tax=Medicago truncatula TaxID=3880 RepID=A0A072U1Z7_MEDTR|nr:hypothetical protein MTR_7g094400 [Medicago truncatula]